MTANAKITVNRHREILRRETKEAPGIIPDTTTRVPHGTNTKIIGEGLATTLEIMLRHHLCITEHLNLLLLSSKFQYQGYRSASLRKLLGNYSSGLVTSILSSYP